MNNPFDYIPDALCEEAFRELVGRLDRLKRSDSPQDIEVFRELESGKMLGVLIAVDNAGVNHTLYAFSGQLGSLGFYFDGFVGPVFDYLQPDGYFKRKEAYISRQNAEIALFEEGIYNRAKTEYKSVRQRLDAEVEAYREKCRLSKSARRARREAGLADEDEMADMIRRSQFEKAELHRLKKRAASALEPFSIRLAEARSQLDSLKEKRHAESEALQAWLFSNFRLLNARGESRSLAKIFSDTSMGVPPSGAGECCAPKLLQAAYRRGWHPVSIAEYWYGKPKGGEVRRHGEHYPACRGKCLPILGWMLQGLCVTPPLNYATRAIEHPEPELIYENRWFCVVDKPSGMLSVPGKGETLSVREWLAEKYGQDRDVRMVHRLDQDTSGLIIAAFGQASYRILQTLFAVRKIKKTYIAELDGDYEALGHSRRGRIELPLSPDWMDRPRQRIDMANGKEAVTDYEFTGVSGGRSRINFHPLTGRTHQLRVHSASEQGLGMPITGDPLYGKNMGLHAERLHLHAHRIEFTFPLDGKVYAFESPVPF